ncbi:GTPase activating protein (Evi5)-like protein [Coleophoma cylindrospora]|uniref:GTPase activating protein (Evi5)-like protein n=1 Tax=Coleophoma cylindrospora TaxID=1849047 RepID=A0A3D8RZP0_9HELO|nr:GTPase activating protein (Evi5)-like protein [Coleophoma cylindrospora]
MDAQHGHQLHNTTATEDGMEAQAARMSSMLHDSMVTVRLSEPPTLTVDTSVVTTSEGNSSTNPTTPEEGADNENSTGQLTPDTSLDKTEDAFSGDSPRITMRDPNGNEVESPTGSETAESQNGESRRESASTEASDDHEVNWEELEKTEEQQPRDQESDDSTSLLLARLEQENNLIATNPKSGIVKVESPIEKTKARGMPRPPSIQQLKKMVNGPTPSALRYSVLPPPPMTELEFWGALVQDYTRTAQRLPTLLSKKIRGGVPPPLRGVVWQSMSGARDRLLEDQFDRLCGESSPYEGIIGKDLGRSFPGVDMFRDPEGDGQRMLGRVLKCFSLYDHKIGYCQGLGFLVGPLLMHMGDKQAFCVLVRLMENYDLRSCFLPDLSGLHVRIYQFKELLKQHLPNLSAHLDHLQVEPAYISQWFLSFFAVTCPLPMLFRIYDVIFAEGASETIMRVALSLMRKNEEKILASNEFEDVMQLLLSRGLWDVYHYNADEFVNDFVGLTGVVTNETLQTLEASYKASQATDVVAPSDVVSSATRFLGRLWSGSTIATKSTNLSPSPGLTAPSRPVSFLRRSPSKQSIASTLNSMEGSASESIASHTSTATDATSISRDSGMDTSSIRAQSVAMNKKDKNLHSQIEDLLTALSEMQRDHAVLATQLQREREEREEDRNAVRSLLDGLRKKSSFETVKSLGSEESLETVKPAPSDDDLVEAGDDEVTKEETKERETLDNASHSPTAEELSALLDVVEERFSGLDDNRRSTILESKSQLRDELIRSKEQLIIEVSRGQALSRQVSEHQQEITSLKDELKREHAHIRNGHTERQRLEKQIQELNAKVRKNSSPVTTPDPSRDTENEWPARSSAASGLRELRLGRANSNRSQAPAFNKRTSSLHTSGLRLNLNKENETPVASAEPSPTKVSSPDNDALVLELVQAKTAEAVARQEAEEFKQKLEALRKLLGMGNGDNPGLNVGHRQSPSQSATVVERSTFSGYLTGKTTPKVEVKETAPAPAPAPASTGGGWFGGGWGKRAVSTSGS